MIQLITKGTDLLVTLDEAKSHLRIDGTYDDTKVTSLIKIAQDHAERYTSRAINLSDYKYIETRDSNDYDRVYNKFNVDKRSLRVGKITELTSIKTFDTEGTETAETLSEYQLENYDQYSDIIQKDGSAFPTGSRTYAPLEIEFKAGYTASTLPDQIKLAILELVALWYENREGMTDGSVKEVPHNITIFLDQFRIELI